MIFLSIDVELHEVNAISPGIRFTLTAVNTNLVLRSESTLTANLGNSILCKEILLSQIVASDPISNDKKYYSM